MTESAVNPINIYFHNNKQEWRSRYIELESKKAKHFSCKRYGYNRAFFLSNLYLRAIEDTHNVLSNDDLSFWYSIIKDFKSLDEVPQKVLPKPPTRTSNLSVTIGSLKKANSEWKEKCKFLEDSNLTLFDKTVTDLDTKHFVLSSAFPTPVLSTVSVRNEASNLINLLRHYKAENDKQEQSSTPTTAGPTSASVAREEPTISIYDIFQTVMNHEINEMKMKRSGKEDSQGSEDGQISQLKSSKMFKSPEETKESNLVQGEPPKKRHRNEALEDVLSLISMNKKSYGEVSNLLNNFILKSADSLNSYDFLNNFNTSDLSNIDINNLEEEIDCTSPINQNIVKLTDDDMENFVNINLKNEEIIKEMSKNFTGNPYYQANKKTFISTFNDLFEDGTTPKKTSAQKEVETIDEFDDTKSFGLYNQFPSSSLFTKSNKEASTEDDKTVELNKLCNSKLSGLIRQTEHLGDEELVNVVYSCLEEESRSSSDLESLIRISKRPDKSKEILYKSSRLYQLNGLYTDDYIDVVYKNGKIIPTSAIEFYTKSNNQIRLSGSDKLGVNMDTVEKIFIKDYNQNETISTIMDNLEIIDEKLANIVREYETMHRALYRYINSPEKDPESTNDIEELFNLETLHFVTETLLDTKLKFIQQIRAYFDSQVNLLDSIMPERYYNLFSKILYHPFNQF